MIRTLARGAFAIVAILVGPLPTACFAQGAGDSPFDAANFGVPSNAELKVMLDTVWILAAAALALCATFGFALREACGCRGRAWRSLFATKLIVLAAVTIGFWLLGWGLMFGQGTPYFAKRGLLMLAGQDNSPATAQAYAGDYASISWPGVPLAAKFLFQLMLVASAASIVRGAIAERAKPFAYVLFAFAFSIAIYPLVGHLVWGSGWLSDRGFVDFAGSTMIHSLAGWAALAGALVIGRRLPRDRSADMASESHSLATMIGCAAIWIGWLGYTAGSTMAVDAAAIAEISLATIAAAAAGALAAFFTMRSSTGTPSLSETVAGSLAGLVAISAACAFVGPRDALLIGAFAGILATAGRGFFERIGVDDPLGVTSVHLLCGIFGTLCVGLFATPERIVRSGNPAQQPGWFYDGGSHQLIDQFVGVILCGGYALLASLILWFVLKMTVGVRVSQHEELALDGD